MRVYSLEGQNQWNEGIYLRKETQIVTNNPLVRDKYVGKLDITFLDGKYIDVLMQTRDKVHQGFKVMSHPLAGSIKPNETPYRSVIIMRGDCLDYDSLSIIEDSLCAFEKFSSAKPMPEWNERILRDFQVIDCDLIDSAVESMTTSGAFYV